MAVPRPLRIEYEGTTYHLRSRGDRREPIFDDDQDRRTGLRKGGLANPPISRDGPSLSPLVAGIAPTRVAGPDRR
jgi:hypothetical protein